MSTRNEKKPAIPHSVVIRDLVEITFTLQGVLRNLPTWEHDKTRPGELTEHGEQHLRTIFDYWVKAMFAAWDAIGQAAPKMNNPSDPAAIQWGLKGRALINRMLLVLQIERPQNIHRVAVWNIALRASSALADELLAVARNMLDLALMLDIVEQHPQQPGTSSPSTVDEAEKFIRANQTEHKGPSALEIAKGIHTSKPNMDNHVLPALELRGLVRPGKGSRRGFRMAEQNHHSEKDNS